MALLTFSEEEFVPLIFASFGGTALMNKSDKGVPQHLRREIDGTAFQYKQEGRIKAHTLRTGTRWKAGMDIHFWKGNPRNKSSNPFHFATAKCTAVQKIEMRLKYISVGGMQLIIKVDGKKLDSREMVEFAKNDGFEGMTGLLNWFLPHLKIGEVLHLQLIHWTNKRYS